MSTPGRNPPAIGFHQPRYFLQHQLELELARIEQRYSISGDGDDSGGDDSDDDACRDLLRKIVELQLTNEELRAENSRLGELPAGAAGSSNDVLVASGSLQNYKLRDKNKRLGKLPAGAKGAITKTVRRSRPGAAKGSREVELQKLLAQEQEKNIALTNSLKTARPSGGKSGEVMTEAQVLEELEAEENQIKVNALRRFQYGFAAILQSIQERDKPDSADRYKASIKAILPHVANLHGYFDDKESHYYLVYQALTMMYLTVEAAGAIVAADAPAILFWDKTDGTISEFDNPDDTINTSREFFIDWLNRDKIGRQKLTGYLDSYLQKEPSKLASADQRNTELLKLAAKEKQTMERQRKEIQDANAVVAEAAAIRVEFNKRVRPLSTVWTHKFRKLVYYSQHKPAFIPDDYKRECRQVYDRIVKHAATYNLVIMNDIHTGEGDDFWRMLLHKGRIADTLSLPHEMMGPCVYDALTSALDGKEINDTHRNQFTLFRDELFPTLKEAIGGLETRTEESYAWSRALMQLDDVEMPLVTSGSVASSTPVAPTKSGLHGF
jgi:hypothetical protein